MIDVIGKLKEVGLFGRSGSGFPTGEKWEIVKNAKSRKKYIICNASEGEPGTHKDQYILKYYPEKVIAGIKIALATIENSTAYIYLKHDFLTEFGKKLEKLIEDAPIKLFEKKGGYLAGEETVLCEVMEGKRAEPRLRPPYPAEKGLEGFPTLVNNVETFYAVAKIVDGSYKNERFFTISGDIGNGGVYEFPLEWTITRVLEETENIPKTDFFVHAGGGAAGEILLANELDKKIEGMATIIVYDKVKTDVWMLMTGWIDFFLRENCDKCTPCREGAIRIKELVESKNTDKETWEDLFFALENTSFCYLGKSIPRSFRSLINKVLK